MSLLEELYYGNICPVDKSVKKGSEYAKLIKSIVETETVLLSQLGCEKRTLYEKLSENKNRETAICEKEAFIDGFRIGAGMMLEIPTEPKRQFYT